MVLSPEWDPRGNIVLRVDAIFGKVVFLALMSIRSITVSSIVVFGDRVTGPSRQGFGQILIRINAVVVWIISSVLVSVVKAMALQGTRIADDGNLVGGFKRTSGGGAVSKKKKPTRPQLQHPAWLPMHVAAS